MKFAIMYEAGMISAEIINRRTIFHLESFTRYPFAFVELFSPSFFETNVMTAWLIPRSAKLAKRTIVESARL